MEHFSFDQFIEYSGSPSSSKGEKLPEFDFSLSSPFNDSDPTQGTPPFKAQKSSISSHSVRYSSSPDQQQGYEPYKYKPFTIIRNSPIKDGESLIELCSSSKKIQKRNQAKERTRKKQEIAELLSKTAKKYIPEGIEDPKLDVKSKRRLVQIVKNRISAQRTRDHRKKYISELEEVKVRLAEANHELLERNRMLEERLKAMENSHCKLRAENEELTRRNSGRVNSQQQFLEADSFVESVFNSSKKSRLGESDLEDETNDIYPGSPVLTRRPGGKAGLYRYLLATMMICVIFTGLKIKVGKITRGPRPDKIPRKSEVIDQSDVINPAPDAPDIPILPPQKKIGKQVHVNDENKIEIDAMGDVEVDVDINVNNDGEGEEEHSCNCAGLNIDIQTNINVKIEDNVDIDADHACVSCADILLNVNTNVEVENLVEPYSDSEEEDDDENEEEEEKNRFRFPDTSVLLTNTALSDRIFEKARYNSTFEGVLDKHVLNETEKMLNRWRDQLRQTPINKQRKNNKNNKPTPSEFKNQQVKRILQERIKQDALKKHDARNEFHNNTINGNKFFSLEIFNIFRGTKRLDFLKRIQD